MARNHVPKHAFDFFMNEVVISSFIAFNVYLVICGPAREIPRWASLICLFEAKRLRISVSSYCGRQGHVNSCMSLFPSTPG